MMKVHEGTIGAVTCKGLVSATLAGGMVGLTYELLGFLTSDCGPQLGIIPICAFAGLHRSLLGSLLTVFSHRTTNSDSSNESAYTLRVNEKSDIYSFGVVLLELISGKPPASPEFGEKDLVNWVCSTIQQKGEECVTDSKLDITYKEQIAKVLSPH